MTTAQQQALNKAAEIIKADINVLKDNEKMKAFIATGKSIDLVAKKRDPLVIEYLKIYKDLETKKDTPVFRMANAMKTVVAQQERYIIAANLCEDSADKQALLEEAEKFNNHPAMVAYDKYLKGLEYASGMTMTLDKDVAEFYAKDLHLILDHPTELNTRRLQDDMPQEEKEEQVNREFRKMMAPAKAREIFLKQNVASFNEIGVQFIGEPVRNLPMVGIFNGRMTVAAFMTGKMLMEGYSFEQILDKDQLQDKKKALGEEYMKHREAQDNQWYADEMYKAGEAMLTTLNQYILSHKDTIQTENDFVSHASTMGMLSTLCFDMQQELHRVKNYGSKDFKTLEEFNALEEKIGLYHFCLGTGTPDQLPYEICQNSPMDALTEIRRQLYIRAFLDELKKDKPDLDSILTTFDQFSDIDKQVGTLEEFYTAFSPEFEDEPDSLHRGIYADKTDSKKLKIFASMHSQEFLEQNNIKMHISKVPVTLTSNPSFNLIDTYRVGDPASRVITRDGKQMIKTSYFYDLTKKDLRGNEKSNSDEFNTLLDRWDKTDNTVVLDKPPFEELQQMRAAAIDYINAKRAQKGYTSLTVPDPTIDDQMLGKAKGGPSIFTSRGKDRYEFALNTLVRIQELENKFNALEKEKQKDNKDLNKNDTVEIHEDNLDSFEKH